ncbi:hypothetical protein [Paenisporosarcina sp. OV554]|uniref:hypothetical protein n=1 Tax=Paenisporosarcina sp. OV554 TaxID=2135694 RepID=UPI000D382048|nr:hypothetical protein [Paenisporosarcina sp. OV554]
MRKYVLLKEVVDKICKVMIYESFEDVAVYLYDSISDTSCFADFSFETIEEAEKYCKELGIRDIDWCFIDDPLEGCKHDLIGYH